MTENTAFSDPVVPSGFPALLGLSAGLASLSCCVLPLVLFSFGIGGAWLGRLSALSAYQPYFVGAAVVFVALGALRWRRAQLACRVEGCAIPLSQYLVGGTLVLAVFSIVVALLFPYYVEIYLEGGR